MIEWAIALYEARGDWFKWPLDTVLKPLLGIALVFRPAS